MGKHEKMNPNCKICNEEGYIIQLSKLTAKEIKVPHLCFPDIVNCSVTPSKEKFEEEFEDEIWNCCDDTGHNEITLDRESLVDLVDNYLLFNGISNIYTKVKISAKKGKIVIERIEE